jgi:hypothetical protein
MNSIKKLLALLTLAVITLLITGCATSKYDTGISSYEKMVEKFSLQDLDLSAPEFQSLKKNMICYFDDNTSYRSLGHTVSVCYSENEKVNFVFSTRKSKVLAEDLRSISGYVATRKDNNFQSGDRNVSCPLFKRAGHGFIATCKSSSAFSTKSSYDFASYAFRGNEFLMNIGDKSGVGEHDSYSLIPKIKEVLLKVK